MHISSSTGIAAASIVLILALSGCSGKGGQQDKGKGPRAPMTVNGYILRPANLENELTLNGSLMPNEQVELKAESQGKIIMLNLNEGTTVAKGELLAKLNDADLQANLKRQKAQEGLYAADERRKHELLQISGISQQEYEQAKTQLEAIKAEMQATKAQIEKTEIRAPFSGVVGLRSVSLGAFVNQNSTIAKLVQNNPLKMEFNLPERYSSAIKKGQSIPFEIEGDKTSYSAKIYAIEPEIDQSSRTIKVRGYVSNNGSRLIPGTYIKVRISLEGGALNVVPSETIVPQLGSQNLYVYRNGKAILTEVKIGFRTGTQVEILNGVQPGDTIITTGLLMLKNEMPVTIKVK